MKLASIILPGLLVLAGCTTQPEAPNRRRLVWRIRHRYIANKGRLADCGADPARRKVGLQITGRGSD